MKSTYMLKHHRIAGELLIAVCDKDILGKEFQHNGVNILVNQRFYGEDEYYEDEVLSEILKASQLNVIGKNITELLITKKVIHPATVLWIETEEFGKIGHAMKMGA